MQTIALYTTETMADWEYAHLTTQIATAEEVRPGRFRLLLVGDGLDPVRSLGGLPLSPAADLDELIPLADEGTLAALVVPGGSHYVEGGHERLAGTVKDLVERDIPVAAICGATYFLARNGFLNDPACTGARHHGMGAAPRHRQSPPLRSTHGGHQCLAEFLRAMPSLTLSSPSSSSTGSSWQLPR